MKILKRTLKVTLNDIFVEFDGWSIPLLPGGDTDSLTLQQKCGQLGVDCDMLKQLPKTIYVTVEGHQKFSEKFIVRKESNQVAVFDNINYMCFFDRPPYCVGQSEKAHAVIRDLLLDIDFSSMQKDDTMTLKATLNL